ncbi:centrosomal protein of 290 kDa-like [Oreochromis niloticus]|uniref:centrosomal protein of 290 kDa-like n=1 Tax=Oreochromis niloticus TaxID=8128 RepID=UPI000DF2F6F4|nr:centrosomal protein of 290 kDa-like [Oreochromis niloticus]
MQEGLGFDSSTRLGFACSPCVCKGTLRLPPTVQRQATIKSEKNEFIQKLMETFLTKLSESISKQTELQSEKKSEINNRLQQVKEAAEKLKNQLESKNQQTINSETDEFIQKLMETFITLESKLSESIAQHKELLQEKQAAEKLKNEFKSKCHEMINSEKDEIIQKLMETFLTLESKVSESISQQTEVNMDTCDAVILPMITDLHPSIHPSSSALSEMINSEKEKDEIIKKLMETFPKLESKVSESISQHTEVNMDICDAVILPMITDL